MERDENEYEHAAQIRQRAASPRRPPSPKALSLVPISVLSTARPRLEKPPDLQKFPRRRLSGKGVLTKAPPGLTRRPAASHGEREGEPAHDFATRDRQQGLFVVVAASVAADAPFRNPVRGNRHSDEPARDPRRDAGLRADRQMPVAGRRRHRGLGIARHRRVPRRKLFRAADLAARKGRPRPGARAGQRDARGFHGAARPLPHTSTAAPCERSN